LYLNCDQMSPHHHLVYICDRIRITTASESHSVIGDFPLPCLNISGSAYLSASCEPLGLLVEEPEVGGPEKAVEEAKEDRDVALAELGTGAAAINRILLAEHGSNRQARADIFQAI